MIQSITLLLLTSACLMAQKIDWQAIEPDLKVPEVTDGEPGPGKRVRHYFAEYKGTQLYHALYFPTDWKPGGSYPVIIEYAGNRHAHGDGSVESCKLGYGITGGKGAIWVSMPFVDPKNTVNSPKWWGDPDATVKYCKQTVKWVCGHMGGDASRVFIAGFSRGSIAANYIGLHDDEIAKLWCGFICHSHYEGVRNWGWTDPETAADRLKRLGDRPQYISQENSVNAARTYLKNAKPAGNFTFVSLPFPEHTDRWVLRDIPPRKELRDWFGAINASVSWKKDQKVEDFLVLKQRLKKGSTTDEVMALLGEFHGHTQDEGHEHFEYLAKDEKGRSFAWCAEFDENHRLLEWSGPTKP